MNLTKNCHAALCAAAGGFASWFSPMMMQEEDRAAAADDEGRAPTSLSGPHRPFERIEVRRTKAGAAGTELDRFWEFRPGRRPSPDRVDRDAETSGDVFDGEVAKIA
jgi:hypothetical protein